MSINRIYVIDTTRCLFLDYYTAARLKNQQLIFGILDHLAGTHINYYGLFTVHSLTGGGSCCIIYTS